MRKSTIALTFGMAGLLTGMLLFDKLSAQNTTSYGEDRAQIEDLQARYLFALDFNDPKLYASTFTPDGVLDYGSGEVKVVLHQAQDLQRRQRTVAIQRRCQSGLVNRPRGIIRS